MATDASVDNVTQLLNDLSLPALDKYPNCYPEINPVDIYRSHVTSILHKITGVDTKVVYNAVQWTMSLDKGDLVVAIPALRVKGKPEELGKKWLEQVGSGLSLFLSGNRPTILTCH